MFRFTEIYRICNLPKSNYSIFCASYRNRLRKKCVGACKSRDAKGLNRLTNICLRFIENYRKIASVLNLRI